MPRIGVDSGATIIAPMTVAVLSATTPETAMTPDSVSINQKALRLAVRSPTEVASSARPVCS